jgi:hypothetical protein
MPGFKLTMSLAALSSGLFLSCGAASKPINGFNH